MKPKCKHTKVIIIIAEQFSGGYNPKTNTAWILSDAPIFAETTIKCKQCGEELGADLI